MSVIEQHEFRSATPSRVRDARNSCELQTIAVVIGQLAQGGSERQLYMFLAHCDRARWSPSVYVSGELGFWEKPIRELGIPVVLLQGSPVAKLWQFRAACRIKNIKCLFSWSSYTNAYGLALIDSDIRRIGSFRNELFADLPQRGRRAWTWACLAGISRVVCNSRETFEAISRRVTYGEKKVFYVPNAVELFSSGQLNAYRDHWRRQLGLEQGQVLVLGVGRLAPQKNFARFIDVIARVAQQTHVHGVIAGEDHGCLDDLKSQASRLGLERTIRFLGKIPDARELICAADIFLLSSDHEGMPNVVLEAMSAGVPCVSTNVNGIGDLIRHGANGFVSSEGADALASHVEHLATHAGLRRFFGMNARAAVEPLHRPENVASRLWNLCDQSDD